MEPDEREEQGPWFLSLGETSWLYSNWTLSRSATVTITGPRNPRGSTETWGTQHHRLPLINEANFVPSLLSKFRHLSLSDTQDVTSKAEHSRGKPANWFSKLSRTDRCICIYISGITRCTTRSFQPELARIDTLSLICTDDIRTSRDSAAGTTRMIRGPDQGYRHADRRHTTHSPLVLRSFSAERRRTNKSWDPAWNCVGRLLLLPPRHSVLSHRWTGPGHRQRQAGE